MPKLNEQYVTPDAILEARQAKREGLEVYVVCADGKIVRTALSEGAIIVMLIDELRKRSAK